MLAVSSLERDKESGHKALVLLMKGSKNFFSIEVDTQLSYQKNTDE